MDKKTLQRLERGREHYKKREYSKAEPYLLKVAQEETGFADIMNMLGVIYHDRGQVALAQEYFEKSIRINPRYTEAALNLAVTYNEQGMYDQARKIHEHATSLQFDEEREIEPFARGKLTNMHADLGQAYAELQILDKAIFQYREALSLNPGFVDIRTTLGQLLKDAGHFEEAILEFEMVEKERPGYIPAMVSLGATLFAMGDKEKARAQWAQVLEQDPSNRTAGMYFRLVDQMLAQEEAAAAGINLEVEEPTTAPKSEDADGASDLDFSFEGERASVAPAASVDEDTDDE